MTKASINNPKLEKYHWQAAGSSALNIEPFGAVTSRVLNVPPSTGLLGLINNLKATLQAEIVWAKPQLTGP